MPSGILSEGHIFQERRFEAVALHLHSATALPQQADVVIGLPQHVVGQERQDYGTDFALQNSFGSGFFEVPEP